MFEVHNSTDLLTAFDNKEEEFVIKGDYCKDIREYAKSQLSETELLGIELGGAGIPSLFGYLIEAVMDLFSHESKEKLKIEKKLRLYKIESIDKTAIKLRLRQLDYWE